RPSTTARSCTRRAPSPSSTSTASAASWWRSTAWAPSTRWPVASAPPSTASPPPSRSDPVELQHLDGVAAQDLVGDLVVEAGEQLLHVLLGVRPRGVGWGVGGLEADVVGADLLERVQAVVVGGEAAVDAAVVVGGRRL